MKSWYLQVNVWSWKNFEATQAQKDKRGMFSLMCGF